MKQLITDQLIEEYQREILIRQQRLRIPVLYIEDSILKYEIKMIESFIYRLQSLRQQEMQNVIDAADFEEGVTGQDYFNQTFKQPKINNND